MIKVDIKKDKIVIKGHAGYDKYGKDIVCASVSTLAISSVNAMLKFDKKAVAYSNEDGYLEINILKHNKEIDIIIANMIDMLNQLEADYKDYIKINREV